MNGVAGRRVVALGAAVLVVLLSCGFFMASETDMYVKIDRGITLFGRVYKEIASNYVDEVDPEKFMQAGIDGMLGTLDPYTTYITREEGDEMDLVTNGRYGGIGVTIGQRDGALRVTSVMDGYSAQRQGIMPGDVLIGVDSVSVVDKKAEEVRNLTRGEPGTQVRLKIAREGVEKPMEFVLLRQEIQLHAVTYADYIEKSIGYVRFEHFSRKAGEDVRQALQELKVKGDLKGLVFDLRGNPGGLLSAAVEVSSKFLPKGSLVVSTHGRTGESEQKYFSTDDPVLPTVPVVILTDHGSASASEIVAGALQDQDRAVIVGTRSYGKGLVQTILPLNYGAQLKVTTARYYTPSGRCIQEIDYQHKDKDGDFMVTPDSLRKQFKTVHGRTVFERGGISPDSTVKEIDEGAMVRELNRKGSFFRFANHYVARHAEKTFAGVTPAVLEEFKAFLSTEKFDFAEETESRIRDLRKIAEQSHYDTAVLADLDHVVSLVDKEKKRAFERYADHMTYELSQELASRYTGEHGRIEASLKDDVQLKTAVAILRNPDLYKKKVGGSLYR